MATSILKIALAIVIAFFIIVGIIIAVIIIINYFWGQTLRQEVRETMSNPFNFSLYSLPSECLPNPDNVLCKLAVAKQKVEQLYK